MKSEWKDCYLGDAVTFQRGYDLPKDNMINGDYPVIGSNGIIGHHNEYTTEAPSITVGRSGNVGKPFLYKGKSWSHNTTLFITDYKNSYPYFIFYLLKILNLENYAGGSAVPTLNRNHIHNLKISIPKSETVQRKIANILLNLDDKINLNNQINDNLEQQIELLFKNALARSVHIQRFKLGEVCFPKQWKTLSKMQLNIHAKINVFGEVE